ncbi:MAG: hypothetical protein N4A40_09055 [Tissierellales bacterium]|jgi:hypothetical protein|nr:hypothetical protein [Tissierellales bacterium]
MIKFIGNKKMISVLLVLMLCFSSSAFAKKSLSDKYRLTKAFENFAALKSYTQNLELSMNISSDAMMYNPYLAIVSDSKFILNSKVDVDNYMQTGKATLNFMNQPYPFEYYISPNSFTFLSPFDERYVKLDDYLKDDIIFDKSKLTPSELQEFEKLYSSLVGKFFGSLDKKFIKSENKIVDKKSMTEIKISLNHENFIATLKSFVNSLKKDDDFLALAALIYYQSYDSASLADESQVNLSDKELKDFFYTDLEKNFNDFLDKLEQSMHFDKIEINFLITRGNQLADSSYTISVSDVIKKSEPLNESNEESEVLPSMIRTYVLNLSFSDLNSTNLDKLPKLSKEQTMTMEEFSDVMAQQFNLGYSDSENSVIK